jgi:hypothetical protein
MLEIKDDCPDIDEARMINLVAISGDIKTLEGNLNNLSRVKGEETNIEISSKLNDLHSSISAAVKKTKKVYEEASDDFIKLCEYIGEPKESTVETIISILSSVVTTIDSSVNAALIRAGKGNVKRRGAVIGNV